MRKNKSKGKRHPYMVLANWMDKLAFWREVHPGSLQGYKTEAYEEILRERVKHHRNIMTLK